jgi:hypothetical protein
MNDVLKTIAVFFIAVAVGAGGYVLMDAIIPVDDAPNRFEEADTDDLTAGRYHQRTRTNDFFRRGTGRGRG